MGHYVTTEKEHVIHLLLQLRRGAYCKLYIIISQQMIMIVHLLLYFEVQIGLMKYIFATDD